MNEQPTIRVMVVDDHDLFRDGIVSIIRAHPDMDVVGEAADGLAALVLAQSLRPNVILLDVTMPGTGGLEAARLIAEAAPEIAIVMLTVRDEDPLIFEAIRSGARGYLLKTIRAQQLVEMIRAAANGEAALTPALAARVMAEFRRLHAPQQEPPQSRTPPDTPPAPVIYTPHGENTDNLTFREQEILSLLAAGKADKEIAAQLGISLYTVKAHVRSILGKLQVNNRRAAVRRMTDDG
jgi:two-component system, NarL family, response regulator DegU